MRWRYPSFFSKRKKAALMKSSDPLSRYKEKRDFSITPEPDDVGKPSAGQRQFVIQKHWASNLHYDLRLEIDGSMKSWAVPKGPSLDPSNKRMAVQVEDHPMSYNSFEGVIPPKQYGAGRVLIWDKGTWEPEGDPAQGWRDGRLKFVLHGHKLSGHWALVRMGGKAKSEKPAWLLIKEKDGHARPESEYNVVEAAPDSLAGLAPSSKKPKLAAAVVTQDAPPKATSATKPAGKPPLPDALAPQLATLVSAPPRDAEQWMYELKFDGYRILSRVDGAQVQLVTRNGNNWTHKLAPLVSALKATRLKSVWLDGEIVAMDAEGKPDFQKLQNAFNGSDTAELVYYVFDVLYADGKDLRAQPLKVRREQLRSLLVKNTSETLRLSEAFEARPEDLVASACKMGFEGVIGKRKHAAYASGRSNDWIKLKCGLRQEFVVGGYTEPKGSRVGLGSLLLGFYDEGGDLQYAGNVGTGFTEETLRELHRQLKGVAAKSSPFAAAVEAPKGARWVRPTLVAEVAFAQWTHGHRIRHSVFKGLRTDKPPRDIRREEVIAPPLAAAAPPKASRSAQTAQPAASAEPRITHGERVIDPSTGITKIDLVRYYAAVAPLMLEHLKARPVALVRAPSGMEGELFFQKHQESEALAGMQMLDPALDEGHAPLLEVLSAQGLRSGAQMNVIEYHTWNALKDKIERPDRMTFDLDPGEGVAWPDIQEGTRLLRVLLEELGLPSFLKTSGGKGLHVVVPLKRLRDWDTVKDFSKAIVQHLTNTIPQRFVAKSGPRNRVGKIFVDYLRNGRGATTVSAWSARARPGMGVSVPVAWEELDGLTSAAHWNVQTIEERLAVGNTPWQGYREAAVSLGPAMKMLGFKP